MSRGHRVGEGAEAKADTSGRGVEPQVVYTVPRFPESTESQQKEGTQIVLGWKGPWEQACDGSLCGVRDQTPDTVRNELGDWKGRGGEMGEVLDSVPAPLMETGSGNRGIGTSVVMNDDHSLLLALLAPL